MVRLRRPRRPLHTARQVLAALLAATALVEALLAAHLAELDGVPAERVADLAEQLSFLLEGAMARAGLEGDSRRLHRVRGLALQLVDAAEGDAR